DADARFHGRYIDALALAQVGDVASGGVQVGSTGLFRRLQQVLFRLAPIGTRGQGDDQGVYAVQRGQVLVEDGFGQEHRVRHDQHPPGQLLAAVFRTDFQDLGREHGEVDHLAADALERDAVADPDDAGAGADEAAGGAHDPFLGDQHDGHGETDHGQGQGAQLLSPDHHQAKQEQQHGDVSDHHQPAPLGFGRFPVGPANSGRGDDVDGREDDDQRQAAEQPP